MDLTTLISIGYYVSSIGFLAATYVTFEAFRKAPQSGLKTVLSYMFIGSGTFFAITVFQKLADMGTVYKLAEGSSDIWWHIMFYMAMISFYIGFKTLASLGTSEQTSMDTTKATNASKVWGWVCVVLLAIIFVIPNWADSFIQIYTSSKLAELGAHHFVAFVMAGIVGAYLFSAKLFLGNIGKAIASPMIIAIWALALQHFWELLNESWKVIIVTPDVGEGVEKIFLTIAAICVIFAALRLKALAKA